jgi:hypothetical protein
MIGRSKKDNRGRVGADDGTLIALIAGMTRDTKRNAPTERPPMPCRSLQRETGAITCHLDIRGARSYEVCVVPHWDPSSAVIERYDAATPALLRHAEVARLLREDGWMVIDLVATDSIQTAA